MKNFDTPTDQVVRLVREWFAERFDAHPKSAGFMTAAEVLGECFEGVLTREFIAEVAEDLDKWASYFVRDEFHHLPPYSRR